MNDFEFCEEDLRLDDTFEPLTVEEEKKLAEHLREYRESPFYLGDELFFIDNDEDDDLFIL